MYACLYMHVCVHMCIYYYIYDICMYVFICVCIELYMYVCVLIYANTYNKFQYVQIHTIYKDTYTYIHIQTHTCKYHICNNIYTYVHIHAYINIRTCIYTYKYIHTHTYNTYKYIHIRAHMYWRLRYRHFFKYMQDTWKYTVVLATGPPRWQRRRRRRGTVTGRCGGSSAGGSTTFSTSLPSFSRNIYPVACAKECNRCTLGQAGTAESGPKIQQDKRKDISGLILDIRRISTWISVD